jgi:hypothetical protein
VITFDPAADPVVRTGAVDVAGRRIAVRAVPYSGRVGAERFGFDPIDRTIFRRRSEGAVAVGPVRAEPWRAALARLPAGPALVGPGDESGEPVWGACAAAVEGARASGRAVYLLDPPSEVGPEGNPAEVVALFTWSPSRPVPGQRIRELSERGVPGGCLLPLLPGWTSDRAAIAAFVEEARRAGARFVAPVLPDRSGVSRRAIVEARAETAPDAAEQIFGRIHHSDWDLELSEALVRLAAACSAEGLENIPPRPVGRGEPARNAAASARLEELARASDTDEHRLALLHAAVRWIDESARDLAAVAREGNLRRVFPFGAELAAEAERALLGVPA